MGEVWIGADTAWFDQYHADVLHDQENERAAKDGLVNGRTGRISRLQTQAHNEPG